MSEEEVKFYNKKWFTVLMLVFFAPLGIFFMWKNKFFEKSTRKILTVVFMVWFVIALVAGQPTEEEKAAEQAKQEQIEKDKEDKKKAEEEKKKQEEVKKKKDKEEKPKPKNRTTAEAIQEDSKDVDKAEMDGNELVLEFEPGTIWNENSLMAVVYDMFKEFQVAFSDEKIDSVSAIIHLTMIDEKGNESVDPVITYRYTREGFEELNYENFLDMSFGEEWRILNESESYFIHPGIRTKLKDKYKQNLR